MNRSPQGSLHLAIRHLDDAIGGLTDRRWHSITLDGGRRRRVRIASRYRELSNAVGASRYDGGGATGLHPRAPFWLDAHLLLCGIDREVIAMHPAPHRWPGWTVPRLTALRTASWRPQDIGVIYARAAKLKRLSTRVDTLFAPRPWYLPDPCPACNTVLIYRDPEHAQISALVYLDTESGELIEDPEESQRDPAAIRQPALAVTADGCRCQQCHATWAPDRLKLLGAVLGYTTVA